MEPEHAADQEIESEHSSEKDPEEMEDSSSSDEEEAVIPFTSRV